MSFKQLKADFGTRQDELLQEILLELKNPSGSGGNLGIRRLTEIAESKEKRDLDIVFFTYPATGETVTLATGTTILDFEAGTITNTADVTTNMQHSLRSERKDFLRSLYVNSDKAIKVMVDSSDVIFVDEAKDLQATYLQFKKVTITTTENTEAFVLCCTNPEAILTLVDKSSEVSGGDRLVYGDKIDEAGGSVLDYFDLDLAPGSGTATKYISLTPALTKRFRLESVRFYIDNANSVTYQLFLLEQASAHGSAPIQQKADIVYDSGALIPDAEEQIDLGGGVLPIEVNLADTGKLYYMLSYSAAPGNCKGYIVIRGTRLA